MPTVLIPELIFHYPCSQSTTDVWFLPNSLNFGNRSTSLAKRGEGSSASVRGRLGRIGCRIWIRTWLQAFLSVPSRAPPRESESMSGSWQTRQVSATSGTRFPELLEGSLVWRVSCLVMLCFLSSSGSLWGWGKDPQQIGPRGSAFHHHQERQDNN